MANLVRIGETLINLDYVMSIEANAGDQSQSGVASVHLERGRCMYFEGADADAVRQLVRTFPRFPSAGGPPGGTVEYSAGSEPLPDRVRKVNHGE